MTLGYSALPCGMGLMFQSLSMALVVPTLVLTVMVIWLKVWEEPHLDNRFGAPYRAYQKRTPFLVPHPKVLIAALFSH
jgi:protein-S-isoprenylcysteine O-methyltransferase Ste14